jgi:phosphatidylglycerophosphatase A
MMRLALFVCTFGGVGYSPVAPGTAGSAAGLVVYAALRLAGATPLVDALVIGAMIVAGIWSGTLAERHFGTTDPGPGVIDEVAGMLVTLYALPTGWVVAIGGFFLFRVLDVFKPFPAQRFERLHGGLGMMADDLMVAVYGNLLLRAAIALLPGLFFA